MFLAEAAARLSAQGLKDMDRQNATKLREAMEEIEKAVKHAASQGLTSILFCCKEYPAISEAVKYRLRSAGYQVNFRRSPHVEITWDYLLKRE